MVFFNIFPLYNRDAIIDGSFTTMNFYRENEELPKWFVEDEKKHNFKRLPVTKDDVMAERERLLAINNRAPKKVKKYLVI